MWNYLFNPFGSKKTSDDVTPFRGTANSVDRLSLPPKPHPIEVSPPHIRNDNDHAKDSFDSDDTHDSELKHPPSTKKTSSSALDMVSIHNTTQKNKKPKSRKKRSSKRLTITASHTNNKTFEWHNPDGFPPTKTIPIKAALSSATGSGPPAKKRRIDDAIVPKYGCDAPDYKYDSAIHWEECRLLCDARESRVYAKTLCPNCKCYFHKSCVCPLGEPFNDVFVCKHCHPQVTK